MRALLFLILSISMPAFADGDLETKLQELAKKRDDDLFAWRTANKFEKLPNEKYVQYHNELWNKYSAEEISLYAESCKTVPENCLTATQEAQKKAEVRIVMGLLSAKNEWASSGKSESEQKTAEENFNRCARENKDCDKLPEVDRERAKEGRVPATDNDTNVVTPNGPAKDISDGEKKVADEIKLMEEEFSKNNPAWQDKEMTAEAKDFLISLENARLEKNLAMLDELCKKYPENKQVCLSEEQKNVLRDATAKANCKVERKFQVSTLTLENHDKEWGELPSPKSCQALLAKDKTEPKKETPTDVVVEEGDDEKTPRNYKAETCKWVTDLPRKVVNGPGCGPRSRSRICTGYVICEQKTGGGKFIRMSTCGADKCGSSDEDAVRCTKDMGYYSQKPAGESKLFMSPKLKRILSGASEQ